MKILAALAAIAVFSVASLAGEATGAYTDSDGRVRLRVTVRDPMGEVGLAHFRALKVGLRERGRPAGRDLNISAETVAAMAERAEAGVRGFRDKDGSFLPDWSGVRASLRVEQVDSCEILVAELVGTVARGASIFFDASGAMGHITVLTTRRGDADLFVYDDTDALTCSSELTKLDRIADQCYYLSSTCGTGASPVSTVEVFGVRRRNDFHLKFWFVDAL